MVLIFHVIIVFHLFYCWNILLSNVYTHLHVMNKGEIIYFYRLFGNFMVLSSRVRLGCRPVFVYVRCVFIDYDILNDSCISIYIITTFIEEHELLTLPKQSNLFNAQAGFVYANLSFMCSSCSIDVWDFYCLVHCFFKLCFLFLSFFL